MVMLVGSLAAETNACVLLLCHVCGFGHIMWYLCKSTGTAKRKTVHPQTCSQKSVDPVNYTCHGCQHSWHSCYHFLLCCTMCLLWSMITYKQTTFSCTEKRFSKQIFTLSKHGTSSRSNKRLEEVQNNVYYHAFTAERFGYLITLKQKSNTKHWHSYVLPHLDSNPFIQMNKYTNEIWNDIKHMHVVNIYIFFYIYARCKIYYH